MVYVFQSRRSERNGFSLSAMTKTQKFFLWQTKIVQTFSQSMRTTFQNCYSDLFSYELNWFGAITRTLICNPPWVGQPSWQTPHALEWWLKILCALRAEKKQISRWLFYASGWAVAYLIYASAASYHRHKYFTHTVAQLGNDLKVFTIINVGV